VVRNWRCVNYVRSVAGKVAGLVVAFVNPDDPGKYTQDNNSKDNPFDFIHAYIVALRVQ
jgi:hypothetical protein